MNKELYIYFFSNSVFIIFASTFAGAFIGEFYREAKNKKSCNPIKFISTFLASWIIAASIMLLLHSALEVGKNEAIIGFSIFFGFIGHRESLKYGKSIIDSKLKK